MLRLIERSFHYDNVAGGVCGLVRTGGKPESGVDTIHATCRFSHGKVTPGNYRGRLRPVPRSASTTVVTSPDQETRPERVGTTSASLQPKHVPFLAFPDTAAQIVRLSAEAATRLAWHQHEAAGARKLIRSAMVAPGQVMSSLSKDATPFACREELRDDRRQGDHRLLSNLMNYSIELE